MLQVYGCETILSEFLPRNFPIDFAVIDNTEVFVSNTQVFRHNTEVFRA